MNNLEILEAFNNDKNMAGFVDGVKTEDYGFSFIFDGFLECAIVKDGDMWIDVQDCNLENDFRFSPRNKQFIAHFLKFDSLEELIENTLKLMDPEHYLKH